VLTVVLAIVVAIVFRTFVIQTYWIPSESMLPTLLKDDRVAVTRLGDYTHPARGDVIVFSKPAGLEDAENTIDFLIKRVVGLPGDSMAFVNGRVYVNGQPLAEPYLAPGTMTENIPGQPQCTQAAPCLVPPDHVFAMGDNRTNSEDSRYRVVGPIPERTIVGRAVARVWPISRLSGL
jgi:signal peptidase I